MSDQHPPFPAGPPEEGEGQWPPPPPGAPPGPSWPPNQFPDPNQGWQQSGPPNQGWQQSGPPNQGWQQPGQPNQGWQQPGQPNQGWQPQPPAGHSSRGVLLVVAVVVVVLLAIGGLGAALFLGRNSDSNSSATAVVAITATTEAFDPGQTTEGQQGTTGPGEPSATTAPTPAGNRVVRPAVPNGFKLVADDDKGYAFVMPRSWTSTGLTAEQIDEMANRLRATNPALAASLDQFKSIASSGGLAFAFGQAGSSGLTSATLNLLRLPSGGLTVDQVAAQAELGLGAVNAKILSKDKVTVGGHQAIEVSIEIALPQGKIMQKQLYLDGGSDIYVFTVAGEDDPTSDTILRSLKVR